MPLLDLEKLRARHFCDARPPHCAARAALRRARAGAPRRTLAIVRLILDVPQSLRLSSAVPHEEYCTAQRTPAAWWRGGPGGERVFRHALISSDASTLRPAAAIRGCDSALQVQRADAAHRACLLFTRAARPPASSASPCRRRCGKPWAGRTRGPGCSR